MKNKKAIYLMATFGLSVFMSSAQSTCGRCSTTPVFTDSLNNQTQNSLLWTYVSSDPLNGAISFTNPTAGAINYIANGEPSILGLSDNRDTRVYRSLSSTLPNYGWRAQCTVKVSGGNGPAHSLMALTSGTLAPATAYDATNCATQFGHVCNAGGLVTTNQDAIIVTLLGQSVSGYSSSPFSSNAWYFFAQSKHGSTYDTASSPIYLPALNTNYTVIVERLTSSSGILRVLDTSGADVSNSPQCFKINPATSGLNTLQSGTSAGGSWYRSLACTIDNFNIFGCDSMLLQATALPKTVCPGMSTTLCAYGSGCSEYTWQPVNVTGQSIVVTPSVTTTYTVTAHCPCNYTAAVTVSVTPSSSFNADFSSTVGTLVGSNYTISCTPNTSNTSITSAGGGYAWSVEEVDSSHNTIPGTLMMNPANWVNISPNITFPGYCCSNATTVGDGTFTVNKNYKITRYVWGPCQSLTSISYYFSKCVSCKTNNANAIEVSGPYYNDESTLASINTHEAVPNSIKLYPNPADKDIQINLDGTGKKKIEIYDSNGRIVYSSESTENTISINVEGQTQGLYFVKVTNKDQKFQITKFIKQ